MSYRVNRANLMFEELTPFEAQALLTVCNSALEGKLNHSEELFQTWRTNSGFDAYDTRLESAFLFRAALSVAWSARKQAANYAAAFASSESHDSE